MQIESPPVACLTLDDYWHIAGHEENAGKLLELIEGELVEKMVSHEPSIIALWFGTYFNMYLLQNPVGITTGADGGYEFNGELLIPDVGFHLLARALPKPEHAFIGAPDVAVEVKSPTDRKRALRRKAEQYLAGGTRLVLLVFPAERTVEVYDSASDDVVTLAEGDVLNAGAVLPGFTLPLADIFSKPWVGEP